MEIIKGASEFPLTMLNRLRSKRENGRKKI
jgi:hypothetical protein